jgi:hypothetical protein
MFGYIDCSIDKHFSTDYERSEPSNYQEKRHQICIFCDACIFVFFSFTDIRDVVEEQDKEKYKNHTIALTNDIFLSLTKVSIRTEKAYCENSEK